jgi:hypothetical protein
VFGMHKDVHVVGAEQNTIFVLECDLIGQRLAVDLSKQTLIKTCYASISETNSALSTSATGSMG